MNLLVLIIVVAALIALRFVPRTNILVWLMALWAAIFVVLRWGFQPPLPSSILLMFMAIVSLALLAYMSADSERLDAVRSRVGRFITDKKYTVPLVVVVILLPCLVALRVYFDMSKDPSPPLSGRTIHPSPPATIQFKGKTIDLVQDENPFRSLEKTDPELFKTHLENGRRIYFSNCVFCHGDNMVGEGLFAHGFDPIPANFQDPTTIAMLQESYLFWRIAKGGPGLPPESTPWSSAMPAWENYLSEEEIWDVIAFLYDYTDKRPRAREHAE